MVVCVNRETKINMPPSRKGGRRYTPHNKRPFVSKHRPENNSKNITNNKQTQNKAITLEKPPTPSWAAPTLDEEFWDKGYNSRGYDREGFSRSGFNKHGFKRGDYGPDGFNTFGFDREGYNRAGRNLVGLTRANYDVDGYDAYGLDCYGYDRHGLNKYGYSKTDYDANGLDKNGYTCQGLYYDVPGTALVPVRHAMVLRARSDPVYGAELYEKLKEYSFLAVLNAELEQQKLRHFQKLTTDLNLRWTAFMVLYHLGIF